jgi:hypothetical protein
MLAISQASAAEQTGCELDKPPRDAIAFSDHGFYFVVFPGMLEQNIRAVRRPGKNTATSSTFSSSTMESRSNFVDTNRQVI